MIGPGEIPGAPRYNGIEYVTMSSSGNAIDFGDLTYRADFMASCASRTRAFWVGGVDPGTGGLVSVGTVTAQLLYEIGSPAYMNPDVIGHFDTLKMEQEAEDRVFVSGCRGSSAPKTHKVCVNLAGGFRNGTEILLTGIDIEDKAKLVTDLIFDNVGGKDQFDHVDIQLIRTDPVSYTHLRANET